ncbi:MAG: CDP-diacylglycerol--serine O-phosphatidyltransferase [Acidobacteria bacterium]|nr:CDP-diacylglycerol--serine O-phosphatidyltransferase [Acidobacteriota bacterium]
MSQIKSQHPHTRIHPLPRPAEHGGLRRGVSLLPSLFTIANLFCGWACVVHAMRGDLSTAAPFIGIAIVLDMLDGRIARMTGTTSEFGLQLDSLADLISFGMAPAILAFQWGLAPLGRLGWAIGFLFVTAAALRLARFNIQAHTDKRYFVGMPSPAAAAIPAATVFYFPGGMQTYQQALPALAVVLVPALLMVSTIRFRSFKSLDLGTKRSYRGLIALAAIIAAVASRPHEVLLLMSYAYLASAFVGMAMSRLRAHHAAEPRPRA